ncbi:MAG TPA: RES domain-containing protein [Vicinamibacterales bacterium]|nr:RES domain-containing protein [Vicinamibacterales bacterium]
MTLFRCFAWNALAREDQPDGARWCPRPFQGEGRHDNPDVYGCLYLADRPLSCVAEQFAAFRGQRLLPSMLTRRGLPLALARFELPDDVRLVDLDDPAVLVIERRRPSQVATRDRSITQPHALAVYRRRRKVAGLSWWSAWEAQWRNVTLFDRAVAKLRVGQVDLLTLSHPAVQEAADWFGLRAMPAQPAHRGPT